MDVKFGTDGIRGRAGEHPCTAEVGVAVGRAAARMAGSAVVVIARDPRASGAMLESAVAAGVAAEGGVARLCGILPTSGLSAALAADLGAIGVMLTASHNPGDDNGFKVLGRGGKKLSEADSAQIEAWIAAGERSAGVGHIVHCELEGLDTYTAALSAATPTRASLHGRRIAIDLANGAATAAIPWLRAALPGVMFVGDGGIVNDGVGSEHLGALGAFVAQNGFDGGFAVDGDGDRCRLVDHTGAPVDGDALAWLLATASGAEAIAVSVMSTTALEPALPQTRVVRTPVGDKHLAAAMDADPKVTLGAEESGHVLLADGLPTGDGLVTGIRALAAAFARAGSIREAVAGFAPFPRRLTKVKAASKPALDAIPGLDAAIRSGEAALGPHGRVFVRWSGTEPVLRILVEAADRAAVEQVSGDVTAVATAGLR